MGRQQSLTIPMWPLCLLNFILHLAHFLVVILLSPETNSYFWHTDLGLDHLTFTLLYVFCPWHIQASRLTVLDCMNYTKDGFSLCCLSKFSRLASHCLSEAIACVSGCVFIACCVNSQALEGRFAWELLCLGSRDAQLILGPCGGSVSHYSRD